VRDGIERIFRKTICQDSSQYCALAGAAQACSGIRDSAIIIHGSPGCGWAARWMRSDHAVVNYTPIIATSLLENEVIFGGSEKLRKTIGWVLDRWKPKHIFVINGCTGSLINDPAEAIIKEFEQSRGVPIILLDSAGFKGLTATGVDDVFSSVLHRFAKQRQKRWDRVNLIGPFLMGSNNWVYDIQEIRYLLEAIGLSINCVLTYNTSMKEIEEFNCAGFDIYLTYEELPGLAQHEDRHGIRRIGQELPLPIGVCNTEDWYYGISEIFGKRKEAEGVLRKERERFKSLKYLYNATWLQSWLSNKNACIIGPATWASSFANFIYYDLAVLPSVIALYGESQESIDRAKMVLKELKSYYSPIILENPLYIQLIEAVKGRSIEFSIGQPQEKSLLKGHGIPHLSLAGLYSVFGAYNFIPYPSMGFKGVLYHLNMFGRLLEETFHEPERWQDLRYRAGEESGEEYL